MQKILEKTALVLSLTILLSCCNRDNLQSFKIEPLPEGEVYISHAYNSKYGTVVGSRNIYIAYGATPLREKAGTAITPTRKFYFSIDALQRKWPQIQDPRVSKAAQLQLEVIKKLERLNGQQGVSGAGR